MQPKAVTSPCKCRVRKRDIMLLNELVKVIPNNEVVQVYIVRDIEKSFNLKSNYDANLLCVQAYVDFDYSDMNSTKKALLSLSIYEVIKGYEVVTVTTASIDYESDAITIAIKGGF